MNVTFVNIACKGLVRHNDAELTVFVVGLLGECKQMECYRSAERYQNSACFLLQWF